MLKRVLGILRSEEGQAMSEYGLVLAVVAIGAIAALIAFRTQLTSLFNDIATSISRATS